MSRAGIPRPEYPRPQFMRTEWRNLNGIWTYEFDPGRSGLARGLANAKGFSSQIVVPFCPQSRLSGVENTDFIEAMFYHRTLAVPKTWSGRCILLHFGGVDYSCEAFIDGRSAGVHAGGSVSFFFDITSFVKPGKTHDLVLSVLDFQKSGVQPKGKQCGNWHSNGCSYTRTTGIWQTVWMEPVAMDGLKSCRVIPDLDGKAFHFTPLFFEEKRGRTLKVTVSGAGRTVAEKTVPANSAVPFDVSLGRTVRPWSPEDPFLYDLKYELIEADGTVSDTVTSYAGLRKFHIEGPRLFLNNKPVFLRFVLDQGFYPDGVWTAPSDADLKRDIELSLAAGFNGARLHQKVFEERFHYWADKLGYLTWGEFSNGVGSAPWGSKPVPFESKEFWQGNWNTLAEWRAVIERDVNHPSIITWTPANEYWFGSPLADYRRIMTEYFELTKSIDPTRPCNETSGYHHAKTDLWTVHIYRAGVEDLKESLLPEDKPVFMRDLDFGYHGQPYLNDEFGGYKYLPPDRRKKDDGWGYFGLKLEKPEDLLAVVAPQVKLMMESGRVAGYCYTQLTDVEQEQNGVYCYDRTPKAPADQLAACFRDGKLLKK